VPAVACPVCRADNDFAAGAPKTCRRCRADLALIVAAVETRGAHLNAARRHLTARKFVEAERSLLEAEAIQAGADATRIRAVLHLLNRNFPAALRERSRSNE